MLSEDETYCRRGCTVWERGRLTGNEYERHVVPTRHEDAFWLTGADKYLNNGHDRRRVYRRNGRKPLLIIIAVMYIV